jgi:hypothetical protein
MLLSCSSAVSFSNHFSSPGLIFCPVAFLLRLQIFLRWFHLQHVRHHFFERERDMRDRLGVRYSFRFLLHHPIVAFSPRHQANCTLLIVISVLSNASILAATLESGWTQARKSDSTSVSTHILTTGYAVTQPPQPGANRGPSANPRGHREKRAVGKQPVRVRIRFARSTRRTHLHK